MKNKDIEIYLAFLAVILGAVFARLVPHIPNIAPIAALALFSGAKAPKKIGFIIPLAVMVVSDIFLGFHTTIPFVYGSFILTAGIGYLIRQKITPLYIGIGSLSSSVLFFIITNFGVWFTSSMYEKNFNGLMACYRMGIPFFRNTIIGDIFYSTLFFLGYKVVKSLFVLMLPSRRKTERHVGNTV